MFSPQQGDQRRLMRWESEDPTQWEPRRGQTKRTFDKLTFFSLGLVMVGLLFAAIGFFYPAELERDPAASARKNEEAEQDYMKLESALNAVVIAGMILIGLGGLILASIFTTTVLCEECRQTVPDSGHLGNADRGGLSLQTSGQATMPQSSENYGAVTEGTGGH